jgi:hypothetical protein
VHELLPPQSSCASPVVVRSHALLPSQVTLHIFEPQSMLHRFAESHV